VLPWDLKDCCDSGGGRHVRQIAEKSQLEERTMFRKELQWSG